MEIGYKNTMDFLLQLQTRQGDTTHKLVEAGSEKDAQRKLSQEMSDYQKGKIVTNIKSNGKLGQMGDGQLHNENRDIEEIIEQLQENEEDQ